MVVTLSGINEPDKELEHIVTRVFFKEIDLIGGLKKLAEYRTLTWLPSLARASFVVVLKEEYMKTEEEIAQIVGLTKNTVRNILRADEESALKKIKDFDELGEEEKKNLKVHTAGGLAKLAYKLIKQGEESQVLTEFCRGVSEKVAQICEVPWVYVVLKNIKGLNYPLEDKNILIERLKDVDIKRIKAIEIIEKIKFPLKSPAQLLHEIKQFLEQENKE